MFLVDLNLQNRYLIGKFSMGWRFLLIRQFIDDIDDIVELMKSPNWALIDEDENVLTIEEFLEDINSRKMCFIHRDSVHYECYDAR